MSEEKMAMKHVSPEQLEHYVMGALSADEAEHVEAHVLECDVCAAALQREAALEMTLEQVAQAPRAQVKLLPRRFLVAGAAALSLAAATLLLVAPASSREVAPGLGAGSTVQGSQAEAGCPTFLSDASGPSRAADGS